MSGIQGEVPLSIREEFEHLLSEAAKKCNSDDENYKGRQIIELVILSGYKDEPVIDQDGKPLSRRVTPLHRAARDECKDLKVIPSLFKIYDNFDVNYTDELGLTHFHIACQHGCYNVVKKFLELGQVDPNLLVPETGDSPLHLALDNKREQVAKLLLRRGGDPNLANAAGSTALHLICSQGLVDLAKILFELSHEMNRPVQVDARDKFGNTPLLLVVDDAHKYSRLEDKYKYLGSPLKYEYDDHRLLISCMHFMCRSNDQTTAHIIESRRRKDLVKLLLRQGADSSLANADGLTPLHYICKDFYNDDRELAQLLFESHNKLIQPCRVDAQDNLGNTPLHLALKYDNKHVAELLLRRGANPNLANEKGLTPLHHICQRSRYIDGIVNIFFRVNDELNQQVHIDAPDKSGNTPLHLALLHYNRMAVRSLLERGANRNLTNAEGLTSLHLIYLMGYYGLTKMLLEIWDESNQPLEIEARDKLGRTSLQWAVAGLQPEMVDVLLDRGADLSNFVFPAQSHFEECLVLLLTNEKYKLELLLQLSFGALAVIQQLEKRGYELDRSDVLTIMTLLYGTYKLFKRSKRARLTDAEICWYDDEEFTSKAKEIMINSTYSLYDLTRIEPKEAKKITIFSDYFKFMRSNKLTTFFELQREACSRYIFEKLSRGFFQKWAIDPFWVLIHYRLPTEMCELILEKLENQDLCNICFAVKLQNS